MNRYEGLEFDRYVASYYLNKIKSSSKREIPFNLSLAQVRVLLNKKKCQLSGMPLSHAIRRPDGTFTNKFTDVTIDRIDADKGYEMGNVVAACNGFNSIKSGFENPQCAAEFKHLIAFARAIEKAGLHKKKFTKNSDNVNIHMSNG